MLNALAKFNLAIANARHLTVLYDYLKTSVSAAMSYDDLLRSQVVYSVSAFDKLIHDLVRVGMVACFTGHRLPTPKYLGETVSIQLHIAITTATIPPKELLFEQEIVKKLRAISYQDPDRIAEGLSYIWDEKHKWQVIGEKMGWSANDTRTQLKLIANRRNAIVHESDTDPISGEMNPITRAECKNITDFLELCGRSIAELVTTDAS